MTINAAMALLVDELTEGDVPAPLTQEFTLANIWADLARLAGEEVPAEVLAILDLALDERIERLPAPQPAKSGTVAITAAALNAC
jgi:hypothetical protein